MRNCNRNSATDSLGTWAQLKDQLYYKKAYIHKEILPCCIIYNELGFSSVISSQFHRKASWF